MENSKTAAESHTDVARLLMVLSQLDDLCATIGSIATVVPIKGIALLQDLYAEKLDREVSDIDLVIIPGEKLPEVTQRLLDTGLYRLEFDYLSDPANIIAKKKVSLISTSPLLTDVDLHGAFSTKKYFRMSCPGFDSDVASRLIPSAGHPGTAYMHPVDHWLFLATHACFHMFSDAKWVRDLYLLQQRFTPDQLGQLQQRISQYGMQRVAWAAYIAMQQYAQGSPMALEEPLAGTDRKFKRFIINFHGRPRKKGLGVRLTRLYYEFVHIGERRQRRRTYLKLLFPSLSMLSGIYRTRSAAVNLLLYPCHCAMTMLSLGAFQAYYSMMAARRQPS